MTGDIIVNFTDGVYTLNQTFELTTQDSGTNGWKVIYQASNPGKAVISGGQAITGWSLYDVSNNIYRASVGAGFDTRQLYVDGVRAVRARGEDEPAGFTEVATGYTTPSTGTYSNMDTWQNPSDIEVVSFRAWKSFRCPVDTIAGSSITMQEPCWEYANYTNANMGLPQWIENAYELLDEEGEWYLDRTADYLYYKPGAGEDLGTAEVIAGKLQTLVSGTGDLAPTGTPPEITERIQDITFTGLTFAYSTWLLPNTDLGHPSRQAGYFWNAATPEDPPSGFGKMPATVTFKASRDIIFERNLFTHIGLTALEFWYGSRANWVFGNRFDDISGNAVAIGPVADGSPEYDHHPCGDVTPCNSSLIIKHNQVKNNHITNIGVEYQNAVGVLSGFTENTIIDNNEISYVGYTGVSVGWGWGRFDPGGPSGYMTPTTSKDNKVRDNYIHHVVQTLKDGSGVYTLSGQPGTIVSGNHVNIQAPYHIRLKPANYSDESSAFITYDNNVFRSTQERWLIVNFRAHDLTYSNNFSDVSKVVQNCGEPPGSENCPNVTITNHTVVSDGNWPTAAQTIMDNAGITSSYLDIKNIAYNKPATASSSFSPNTSPEKGNDEDINTLWAAGTSVGMSWWQVDLGQQYDLDRIELTARQDLDQPHARRNFEIRASNSSDFSTYTVLGSQGATEFPHQGTWGVDVNSGDLYRYIRAAKTVEEGFTFAEIKVEGRTARGRASINLALDGMPSASAAAHPVENGNDNEQGTIWWSGPDQDNPWWMVDLGSPKTITQVDVRSRQHDDHDNLNVRRDFEIQASNSSDFSTYTVLGVQGSTPFPLKGTWCADRSADATSTSCVDLPDMTNDRYRYLRLYKTTTNTTINFSEFMVWAY